MNRQKFAIFVLVGLVALACFAAPLWATTVSINIPAGEKADHTMDLKVDDHIRIQLNVLGAKSSYIYFSLLYPNSTEVNFGEISSYSHDFVCDMKGEHRLCFTNNDLAENKLVTLNYDVESYMFGMPQTQFLLIFIAVVCVLMVACYALLSPRP